jgi:EmrB/QacA subfamily drug resistance transporter
MDQRWRILFITSIGVFMSSLDLFIVNIAFPDIAADFNGVKLSDLSWVLNSYAIVVAAVLVPFGRLADRAGRKRVFVGGVLAFTIASALAAAAPSVPLLVVARVAQAAAAALMIPASLGIILAAFPSSERAVAVGAWSAVAGVAAALGPPIGGLLVGLSWRWIFLVNLPIGLITAVVAIRALPESRERTGGPRPDILGSLVLAAGIALLTTGVVKGPDWGWTDWRIEGSFVAATALVALFARRSARHPAPVIELPLLRVRSFAIGNLATMVFFAGFSAMLLAGVLLLTEVWGYSVLHAGGALVPGPLTAAIFAAPAGRLGARIGQRPVGVAGGLAFAISFLWLIEQVGPSANYAGAVLPGLIIGGIGVGLLVGSLPGAVTAELPADRFATGTAVFGMARQLGSAIGIAILIALLADPAPGEMLDGLRRGWVFMAGTGLATSLISLALTPVGSRAATAADSPAAVLEVAPLGEKA